MREKKRGVFAQAGRLLGLAVVLFLLGMGICATRGQAASKTQYLLKVNKQQNVVTVYEKDEEGAYTVPVKAFLCSTGSATKLGTYHTQVRYRWRLMIDDVWSQYATRIYGGVLFHSVWYSQKDPSTLSSKEFNKLGTTCSHGCVRLNVRDAKWIYDNCGIGTKVIIYNSKNPGPLGKPAAIRIPAGSGWDPTDSWSKNNPWNDKRPSITGAKNKTIEAGEKLNLRTGVKARSSMNKDITKKIRISGSVDTNTAGKYKITYKVTDELERTARRTITVTVKARGKQPSFTDVAEVTYITKNVEVTEELAAQYVTGKIGNVKVTPDKIRVKLTQNDDGSYTADYELDGLDGTTAKATTKLVVDYTPPYLESASGKKKTMTKAEFDSHIRGDGTIDRAWALEGITVTDDKSEVKLDDIQVDWEYTSKKKKALISYLVADDAGNLNLLEIKVTFSE